MLQPARAAAQVLVLLSASLLAACAPATGNDENTGPDPEFWSMVSANGYAFKCPSGASSCLIDDYQTEPRTVQRPGATLTCALHIESGDLQFNIEPKPFLAQQNWTAVCALSPTDKPIQTLRGGNTIHYAGTFSYSGDVLSVNATQDAESLPPDAVMTAAVDLTGGTRIGNELDVPLRFRLRVYGVDQGTRYVAFDETYAVRARYRRQ